MKLNCCLILGALVASTAAAQTSTNSLPAIPPPAGVAATSIAPAPTIAVSTPEKKAKAATKKAVVKKKAVAAKPAAPKTTVLPETHATLIAGSAEAVVNHVNVRGQAGLKGEVITHVQKGETVNVISQISLDKHAASEPAQWAKISLPTNVTVWVNTKFIDAASKTVSTKKLNLRGGPGENYSVLGVIEKGATVVPAGVKGDWTKIEAPANAYAFIAAMYLKQEASGNIPVNPPASSETPMIPPTPTTVSDVSPIVAQAPTSIPAGAETPVLAQAMPQIIIQTNIVVVNADTNVPPPPPRIVTHEGTVRKSVSIVAPTFFELYDPANDKAINYLFSNTTNLNLARYNGLNISVTGEEGLDARWKQTPVLTVQKIYVLSGNLPAEATKPASAPADAKAKSAKHWYYLWLK